MINRSIAPPIKDAIHFDFSLPGIQHHVCANGIPMYWLKAGAQEVVEVTLVFKAGIWYESQTALAQSVAALLKSGTHTKTALEINEAFEYYGASVKVSANNDWAFVSLYCLSKHAVHILPILKEIITEAAFSQNELDIYKQNAIQRLAVNLKQCDFVANRNIDAMVFGREYPYGKFTEQQDISQLNSEILQQFHKQHYTASNCMIFVAGNFQDITRHAVEQIFGSYNWETEGVANQSLTHEQHPSEIKTQLISNDPNGVQAAIRMARKVPRRVDPGYAELVVMNTIFGGYFGSRLMNNIREDKGYTYGIYSSLISYQQEAVMMIGTEVGRDVYEPALKEIKHEMQQMRDHKVSEHELLLVKNYLLGSILGDLDGPFSIMQRWKTIILNDLSEDTYKHNIQVYKNIDAQHIQDLAQTYLNPDNFYELVVI